MPGLVGLLLLLYSHELVVECFAVSAVVVVVVAAGVVEAPVIAHGGDDDDGCGV